VDVKIALARREAMNARRSLRHSRRQTAACPEHMDSQRQAATPAPASEDIQ